MLLMETMGQSAGYRELRKRGISPGTPARARVDYGASSTACKVVPSNGAVRIGTGQGSMRLAKFQGTAGYLTRMSGGVRGRGP